MDFWLLGYYLGHEEFWDRNIYIHLDTVLVLPTSIYICIGVKFRGKYKKDLQTPVIATSDKPRINTYLLP